MDDTSSDIKKKFSQLMALRTPDERIRMASDMYDSAKLVCLSGLKAIHPDMSERQLRKYFFLRFYGSDVTERQSKKILEWLDQ